jgi:hypothetical protein
LLNSRYSSNSPLIRLHLLTCTDCKERRNQKNECVPAEHCTLLTALPRDPAGTYQRSIHT